MTKILSCSLLLLLGAAPSARADAPIPSPEFRAYLQFRSKYLAAKGERDAWLSSNPGQKVSPALDAKVKNAENAWIGVGRRSQVEENFEKVRRGAADCGPFAQ